ncbi:extensin-like domain-containing protein [Dokdonella sp. MW10]|uniref:extensin-like domain-containing protein n=1 Tax=Dokdonella sp. MW10 TaxID=2992926 RepID=UPI003F7E5A9E
MRRWIVALAVLACLLGLWHLHREGRLVVEDRWLPWRPLDVADTPNVLTRLKLARLDRDADACRAALATSGFGFRVLPDRSTGEGCGFRDAVMLTSTRVGKGPSLPLSCRAAVAFALWERHVLEPAARDHLGHRVVRFEHAGSYACRNTYSRATGPRSRHATADAIDLTGFVLDDGSRVRVLAHWDDDGAKGRFLHEVHRGACGFFGSALGPDYNTAHRDHFHFDRGGFGACR